MEWRRQLRPLPVSRLRHLIPWRRQPAAALSCQSVPPDPSPALAALHCTALHWLHCAVHRARPRPFAPMHMACPLSYLPYRLKVRAFCVPPPRGFPPVPCFSVPSCYCCHVGAHRPGWLPHSRHTHHNMFCSHALCTHTLPSHPCSLRVTGFASKSVMPGMQTQCTLTQLANLRSFIFSKL